MRSPRPRSLIFSLIVLAVGVWLAWAIVQRLETPAETAQRSGKKPPVPVEVAPITRGPIERRRTFTGTLEARAEFDVAPKVAGRVERLGVDLSDEVTRNQVVAVLDDAEYVQQVARAAADLAVAEASHTEAESLLKIAERELDRVERLKARGLSSDSQRDTAKAEQLAKQAQVAVSEARVASAQADLEAARVRLGYTQVTAGWRGGSGRRVVAERFVDEGDMVAANAPLLRIVELDPITAVFFVTERDYAQLGVGQGAQVSTDAYPGEHFQGEIQRIAPVFREATRQARVELRIANPSLRLKPGMFARAAVVLDRKEQATIVPEPALTKRDGATGIFLIDADAGTAHWHPVQPGIQEGDRLEVVGADLTGQVVVLGQQLLDDGSPVKIVADEPVASAP